MGRGGLWADLQEPSLLDRMLDLEPEAAIPWIADRHLDAIAAAFADVVDTRTPRWDVTADAWPRSRSGPAPSWDSMPPC